MAITQGINYLIRELVEKPLRKEFSHVHEVQVDVNLFSDEIVIRVAAANPDGKTALKYYRYAIPAEQFVKYEAAALPEKVATTISHAVDSLRAMIGRDVAEAMGNAAMKQPIDAALFGLSAQTGKLGGIKVDSAFLQAYQSETIEAAYKSLKKGLGSSFYDRFPAKPLPPVVPLVEPPPDPPKPSRWQTLADELSQELDAVDDDTEGK